MTKKYKKIPNFKSDEEESKFWDTHNFTDYIDWSKAVKNPEFSNLKLSTKAISIRFPESRISEMKRFASQDGTQYQSLIKIAVGKYIDDRNATTSSL